MRRRHRHHRARALAQQQQQETGNLHNEEMLAESSRRRVLHRTRKPGASMRPVVLFGVLGYFCSQKFRHYFVPHGSSVSHAAPRAVSPEPARWYANLDPHDKRCDLCYNESDPRSFRLYDNTNAETLFRGPETILLNKKYSDSVFTLTEDALLVQAQLPSSLQDSPASGRDHNLTATILHGDLGVGRPLGGRFTDDGNTLYIADALLGLTSLDLKNPDKPVLSVVASRIPVLEKILDTTGDDDGVDAYATVSTLLAYANSVTIGPKTGKVYFTDASDISPDGLLQQKVNKRKKTKEKVRRWDTLFASKLDLARGLPSGRLCEYNPSTGSVRVLADKIHFANGIAVDKDETYVIVVETFGTNVLRFDLTAALRKHSELLKPSEYLQPTVVVPAHEIPGYLDNADCVYDKKKQMNVCYAAIISKVVGPHKFWRSVPDFVGLPLRNLVMSLPRWLSPRPSKQYTGVLVMHPDSAHEKPSSLVRIVSDPSGKDMASLTGVTASPDNSRLYLGSLHNDYIGVHIFEE